MFPKEFEERMKAMLGDGYMAFEESMEKERYYALQVNSLKTDRESFLKKFPLALKPVPWEKNGFYYSGKDTPGVHPYHEAGVYYIQEPSAMAPAGYLGVRPGERVLDLCAAPGGKTIQLGAAMAGQGILFSNEIHPARARILSENVERMGLENVVVLNETPERLAERFADFFDKILVDAPCSGEGMFRKNEKAVSEWSQENVKMCAKRQDYILDCAARMLRPGGRMVYSTCTFSPEENEGSISRFLKRHEDFSIVEAEKFPGMEGGNPGWIKSGEECLRDTIRLFPHKINGEGHYLAMLEKSEERKGGSSENKKLGNGQLEKGVWEKECRLFFDFAKENLKRKMKGIYVYFGDRLYLLPEGTPSLKGLKVLRPGLHLGTDKKNRFEPAHALSHVLSPEDVVRCLDFSGEGEEIRKYLKGETLNMAGEKGWYLITVDSYGLGWGKAVGGILKNHYPKGLRR